MSQHKLGQMEQEPNSSFTTRENILLVIFGVITVVGLCSLTFLPFYLSDQPQEADIVPVCLLLPSVGMGAILMVWMRHILKVEWRMLVIALILWCVGTSCFSFGGFALITPSEPGEVQSNLIMSLFLCLLPGAGMMLAAAGVYAYSYYQAHQNPNNDAR